jgi:hypothetical protein
MFWWSSGEAQTTLEWSVRIRRRLPDVILLKEKVAISAHALSCAASGMPTGCMVTDVVKVEISSISRDDKDICT